MTRILNSLREETAELHREIEKDNLAGKILDHSMVLEEYKTLLFQNFIAYKSAESEISKYLENYETDKSSRLEQDLLGLGVSDLDHIIDFSCTNEAEAIGAAYVIEGSAMGGMLIGKELKNCPGLNMIGDQKFFSGERSSMAGWNQYLKYLRSRDFSEQEINDSTEKAKETFLLFQKAFNLAPSNC